MNKETCDAKWYPSFRDNWDDLLFREYILEHLHPEATLLDVGAGAGIVKEMNFKGHCAEVVGIDLDPRVTDNPFVHIGIVADATNLPLENSRFDVVIADNVMEHIDDPDSTLAEIFRVLKPGGVLLFKTPNRFHYMPLIAQFTPHWFHAWVNERRGRETADTFPTHYRLNSRGAVSSRARKSGFRVGEIRLVEGRPEYLRFSVFTYFLGFLYERLVNSFDFFKGFRILLIAELVKPQSLCSTNA